MLPVWMCMCMYVRMTDLYECRKIVYLFIMKSPIKNLNSSSNFPTDYVAFKLPRHYQRYMAAGNKSAHIIITLPGY